MIFINMPKIMLDGPYNELTEKIGKLLQSWCDGNMEVPKEISKEELEAIQNELLILDYSEYGRLTDAILLKNPQFKSLSDVDFTEEVSVKVSMNRVAHTIDIRRMIEAHNDPARRIPVVVNNKVIGEYYLEDI